jgi:hypothetical protein
MGTNGGGGVVLLPPPPPPNPAAAIRNNHPAPPLNSNDPPHNLPMPPPRRHFIPISIHLIVVFWFFYKIAGGWLIATCDSNFWSATSVERCRLPKRSSAAAAFSAVENAPLWQILGRRGRVRISWSLSWGGARVVSPAYAARVVSPAYASPMGVE